MHLFSLHNSILSFSWQFDKNQLHVYSHDHNLLDPSPPRDLISKPSSKKLASRNSSTSFSDSSLHSSHCNISDSKKKSAFNVDLDPELSIKGGIKLAVGAGWDLQNSIHDLGVSGGIKVAVGAGWNLNSNSSFQLNQCQDQFALQEQFDHSDISNDSSSCFDNENSRNVESLQIHQLSLPLTGWHTYIPCLSDISVNEYTHTWDLPISQEKNSIQLEDELDSNNLYVKNIPVYFNDDDLFSIFSPFGNIHSCRIMKDDLNNSKGFGFVYFQNCLDASNALDCLNGYVVGGRALVVCVAEPKEFRMRKLSAFSGLR